MLFFDAQVIKRKVVAQMKERKGFVSNSSSTCYIIAVPKKGKKCKCCGRDNRYYVQMLRYLVKVYEAEKNEVEWIDSINIAETKYKVDTLKKGIKFLKSQLKEIDKLKRNYLIDMAINKVEQLSNILAKVKDTKYQINWIAEEMRIIDKNMIDDLKKTMTHRMNEDKKELARLQSKIKKLREFKKKGCDICSLEIDHWDGKTGESIKELLRSGDIDIIEQVNT